MDSVHENETRSVHGVNDASNQQFFNQSNAEFGHFKKPRFSEAMRNPRVYLTINRSKLDIPFKSELCILFQRGKCYYGDNCHYAHSMSDIRNQSFNGPANGYQRNTMNKWKKCFKFSSGKGCPYGDKCQFLHERVGEYRESSAISIVNGADQIECKSLNAGQEYKRLNFRKMKLCNKWEKFGSCPYGVNCVYAHGQAELQRSGCITELECANASNAKAVAMQSSDSEQKTARELRLQGKRCFTKWNVEKINRIYADWIES
ncbi:zinc finger CCCH domain-containing protein 39-like [Olea europaea var. sylvestris]|uniref:Zinc finger CCCH domain-containing 39-like n=1 Tax=Olea europaea subsp. europaea TaxID=158383 RepID=A0A8S0QG23_OLEEU|nr:zinc finger CCCH domain-containing protein 39-like [Olea europaea var. sylvestris]CAA2965768.1 zinc finger CCCH domain-containing 39-like [Olea europaea subsp. europaea]